MKQIKYILISLVLFILIGCGTNTGTTTLTESDIGTGYYIDSAIEGVSYHCGSQKGTTDKEGKFKYQRKQKCTFSINDIILREVAPEKLFDGVQIFEDNVTVAQFLQSLDNDANASNGIKITIKTIEVLKAQGISKLPKHDDELKDIIEKIKENNSDYFGSFITIIEVNIHLEKTRTKIKKDKDDDKEKQDVKDNDDDEEKQDVKDKDDDKEKQDVKDNDDDKVTEITYTLSTITDVAVSSSVQTVIDELNQIKIELDGVQAYDGNKLKQEYDKIKKRFDDVKKLFDDVKQSIDNSSSDKNSLKKEVDALKKLMDDLKKVIDGYKKGDDNSVEAINDIKLRIDGVVGGMSPKKIPLDELITNISNGDKVTPIEVKSTLKEYYSNFDKDVNIAVTLQLTPIFHLLNNNYDYYKDTIIDIFENKNNHELLRLPMIEIMGYHLDDKESLDSVTKIFLDKDGESSLILGETARTLAKNNINISKELLNRFPNSDNISTKLYGKALAYLKVKDAKDSIEYSMDSSNDINVKSSLIQSFTDIDPNDEYGIEKLEDMIYNTIPNSQFSDLDKDILSIQAVIALAKSDKSEVYDKLIDIASNSKFYLDTRSIALDHLYNRPTTLNTATRVDRFKKLLQEIGTSSLLNQEEKDYLSSGVIKNLNSLGVQL